MKKKASMVSRIKRAMVVALCFVVSLTILLGCTPKQEIEPTTVTLVFHGVFPFNYDVYVFSKDKVVHYDLTNYAAQCESSARRTGSDDYYDYFEDPLPPKEAYRSDERALSAEEWDLIVDALNENRFDELPEDISYNVVQDVGSTYIEVQTENERL